MNFSLSLSDFPQNIQKSFRNQFLTFDKKGLIESVLIENFEKGLIGEGLFFQAMDILEKGGKRANIGEIREWSDGKYQRTTTGWIPISGEKISKIKVELEFNEDIKLPRSGTKIEAVLTELRKFDGRSMSQVAKDLGMDPVMVSDVRKKYFKPKSEKYSVTVQAEPGSVADVIGLTDEKQKLREAFEKFNQDYDKKVEELKSFNKDGWGNNSMGRTVKNYGDDQFVKLISIEVSSDSSNRKNYYTARVGYSKSPEFGEEADRYYEGERKLTDTKFDTPEAAAKAADEFAKEWNEPKKPDRNKVLKELKDLDKEYYQIKNKMNQMRKEYVDKFSGYSKNSKKDIENRAAEAEAITVINAKGL